MNGAERTVTPGKPNSPESANAHPHPVHGTRIPFSLLLITDYSAPVGRSVEEAVAAALEGGIDAVMLRDKDLPIRDRLAWARRLRALTSRHGASLIVNGSADLCIAVDADGVHLPEDGLPIPAMRKILGPRRLIGASTHSSAGLLAAGREGADYATLSPVYETASKAAYGPPLGIEAFAAACRTATIPVFALGGIASERLDAVLSRGAAGVAMITAVLASPDPRSAARAFVEGLARFRKSRGTGLTNGAAG